MQEKKNFMVRIPKEIWAFLKNQSAKNEVPMSQIVNACLEKYKNNYEKKLTQSDTAV